MVRIPMGGAVTKRKAVFTLKGNLHVGVGCQESIGQKAWVSVQTCTSYRGCNGIMMTWKSIHGCPAETN
jgi:hypothetical protein